MQNIQLRHIQRILRVAGSFNALFEHHCSLYSQLRPTALGAVFVKLKQQKPPRLGVILNFASWPLQKDKICQKKKD
jgi:hypothetical protein